MTDIVDQLIAEKQKETDTAKLLGWAAEVIQQLRLERDQAVKEANRRDQKWKDGIEQVCGCKIDFCGFGLSAISANRAGPPTFANFIHSLKHKAELADKVIELLKKFRPYLEYK